MSEKDEYSKEMILMSNLDWDMNHIMKINRDTRSFSDIEDKDDLPSQLGNIIEPWLSALFQSEHLSVLLGSGLTTAVSSLAGCSSQGMNRIEFPGKFEQQIKLYAEQSARDIVRGQANFEDDLRVANELLKGLKITEDELAPDLEKEINVRLSQLIGGILETEINFMNSNESSINHAVNYLKSFLISFASRTASRDRLNIFTTNYDRFIEYACDMAGIIILDRFMGKVMPVFRSTKLELDYHYNPPGIRGEPRYTEGVARLTKLHGSIDWRFNKGDIIKDPLSFGQKMKVENLPGDNAVIFPNSSKDVETAFFPYADLFKDFSQAICRPNSTIVTYGYSFGDTHVNRIIEDMLTIPSTHVAIIAYGDAAGRIRRFYERNNPAQFTLLIGNHFGNLKKLVDNYLPKAAIDRLSIKANELKERRGDVSSVDEGVNEKLGEDVKSEMNNRSG